MSTPDFSHIENLKVDPTATAEYVFYDIKGEPTLTAKPAAEVNGPYLNALLKGGSKRLFRRARRNRVDPGSVKENRAQDVKLYSKYVVTGWKNVVDVEEKPVEFSPEACQAFFNALPPDMFDEFRAFCSDLDNFRDEDDLSTDEAEETAKN